MTRRSPTLRGPALLLVLACACAGQQQTESAPRPDRNVLTLEQLSQRQYATVYDAVAALRPNWLRGRGETSIYAPGEIVVYLGSTRLGGVASLRNIPVGTVTEVRWFDAGSATSRWGPNHTQGAILVTQGP